MSDDEFDLVWADFIGDGNAAKAAPVKTPPPVDDAEFEEIWAQFVNPTPKRTQPGQPIDQATKDRNWALVQQAGRDGVRDYDSGIFETPEGVRRKLETLPLLGSTEIGRSVAAGMAGTGQSVIALGGRVAGAVSDDYAGTADEVNRQRATLDQGHKLAAPGKLNQYVKGAAESLTKAFAGSQFGGTAGTIGLFMLDAANQGYTEGLDAGMDENSALRYAATEGAIEGLITYAFQRAGLGGFEKAVNTPLRQAAKAGFKESLKQLGAEVTEENLTELAHAFNRRFSGVDSGALDPKSLYELAKDTTAQTLLTMGLVEGVQRTAGAADRRMQNRELSKLAREFNARNPEAAQELAKHDQPSRGDFHKAQVGVKLAAPDRAAFVTELRNIVEAKATPVPEPEPTLEETGFTKHEFEAPEGFEQPEAIVTSIRGAAGIGTPKQKNQAERRAELESGMQAQEVESPVERVQALAEKLGRRPTKDEVKAKLELDSREEAGFLIGKALPVVPPKAPDADSRYHEAELYKTGLGLEKVEPAKELLKRFERDFSGALPPDQAKPALERLSEGGAKPVTIAVVDVANGAGINAQRGSVSKTNADITKLAGLIRESMDQALPGTAYRLVRKGWKFQVFAQTENQEAVKGALGKAEARVKEYARAEGLEGVKPRDGEGAAGVYFKSIEVEQSGAGPLSKAILKEHAPPRLAAKVPTPAEVVAKRKAGGFLTEKEYAVERLGKAGWTPQEIEQHRAEISALHEDRVLEGYGSKDMRDSSVARGIKHAKTTGKPGVYVEVDIGNLGGLTRHFVQKASKGGFVQKDVAEKKGRAAADTHFAAVAAILRKHLPEAEFFRHGADELGIHLPDSRIAKVKVKLADAAKEVAAYEKAEGLDAIKHTKSGREPGFGIVWGLSAYGGRSEAATVIGNADKLVERFKKGERFEHNGSSRAFRSAAPDRQAGRVEGGIAQAGSGGRQAQQSLGSGIGRSGAGASQTSPSAERRNGLRGKRRSTDVAQGGEDAPEIGGGAARRISAVTGAETELLAPFGKERVPAKFAVVEATDLIPSHDFRGQSPAPRKDYPAGLQPRSYAPSDPNAAKVLEIAGSLDASRLITDAPGMDAGTPTILPTGVVVAGNGRAMGIQRAAARPHNPQKYGEYKKALLSKAAQFGLDPKQIQGLKKPILVRMVDEAPDSETARFIASASNLSTAYRENPVRKAAQLAPLVPDEVFDQLRDDPEATFSALVTDETKGRKFRETLSNAMPAAERGEYFGTAGELTDAGKELVEALMVVKVFPVDLVEKMPRSMRGTLEAAAPQLVMMKRGRGIDILPALREAIEYRLGPLEGGKLTVEEYQGQSQMFEQPKTLSPEGRMLLDFLTENGVKPKAFREGLGALITEAEQTGPGSLLGAEEDNEPGKLVSAALGVERRAGAFGDGVAKADAISAPKIVKKAEPKQKKVPSGDQALAARVGTFGIPVELDTKGEKISNHEIVATMEREFDIPIRTGKVSNPLAAGIYRTKPEVVRLKGQFSGDLAVAAHEVAHHIDKRNQLVKRLPYRRGLRPELAKLDYDPTRGDTHEGFAEFIRHYLSDDDAQQKAPKFFKYFTETWLPTHPESATKIEKIKALVNRWRQQGAEARIKANISQDGKPARPVGVPMVEWLKEKVTDTWHRVYTAMKDEGHFLNLFEREAKEKGYAPREGEGPFALYEAFTQSGPVFAERAIQDGVFAVGEGSFGKRLGLSLREVFEGITPAEYENFIAWTYARHAIESHAKGKNPGITKVDAEYLYNRDKNPAWEQAADRLTAFNNSLIDMLHDAGVITTESAAKIKGAYKTYIPLLRVKDGVKPGKGLGGRKLVNLPDAVRRRMGSGNQILDPVQSTVEYAVLFYERAAKQQVIEKATAVADRTDGMGGWIEKLPPNQRRTAFTVKEVTSQLEEFGVDPEAFAEVDPGEVMNIFRPDFNYRGQEPIARVLRKGKPVLYQFDKDLFRAISGMNYTQLPYFLDITLGRAARVAKLGYTGLNPDFTLRNLIRDTGTYIFQKKQATGAKSLVSPGQMVASYVYSQGMRLAGKDGDPYVKLWQDMGGELSQQLGLDRKRLRTAVDDVLADSTKARTLKIVEHPVDTARAVIGVTEVASRLAEFKATLEKHGWTTERLQTGELPPRRVLVEAINSANDVTTNFKRMGYVGKWINQIVPFFNAKLEGTDKFARTWRDDPKKAFVMSSALAAATVVYWLMRKDDDDYKEQPAWLKYGFWTITDDKGKPIARIPRPHDWGMTVASGTEAILNAINDADPKAFQQYSAEAFNTFTPSLKPAGVTPIIETAFNFDTFRDKPIVDQRLSMREPKDQAEFWTTDLMKEIGAYLNVAPAKLEHLTQGLTGGLYGRSARLIEGIKEPEDIPGPGGLLYRKDYTATVEEFYAASREANQKYTSAQDRAKANGTEADPALWLRRRALNQYSDLIGDLRTLIQGETNRDKRFAVEKYIIGSAREAMGKPALERYPSLFTAKDLPTELAEVRDKFIWRKVRALTKAKPLSAKKDKREELQHEVEDAVSWLDAVDVDTKVVRAAAWAQIKKDVKSPETRSDQLGRLIRHLNKRRTSFTRLQGAAG